MTRTTALTTVTFGILTLSTLMPAFAQDAKAIVAKSAAAYKSMKTYQADIVVEQTGAQGKSKTTITVKKSGAKMASTINTTNASPMGKSLLAITDGKNVTLYMADSKQYMQMPMNPMIQQITSLSPDAIMSQVVKEGTVKKLADSNVNGKPTFVLEGSNPKQPNAPKSRLYIDKATSRLAKIEGNSPAGGGNMTMLIRNEKINPAFPASTFVFTPPKGAKLMQNPMGGGGAPR